MNKVVLFGGAAALGALALTAVPGTVSSSAPVDDWVRKVVARVSSSEGKPDSINANLDGNGVSFGIIQWTQRAGSLAKLLTAMQAADPDAFAGIFGPSWSTMLATVARKSLDPVDGVALWKDPWLSRFRAAGQYGPFVAVQWSMATQGEYWQGAETVAAVLNVRTERAMAVFFDRCVQQGPKAAVAVAEQVKAGYLGRGQSVVGYADLLTAFATTCANRFRRTTAPADPAYSKYSDIVWKQVGAEWHAVVGPWDLYVTIFKRTSSILADTNLTDTSIARLAA